MIQHVPPGLSHVSVVLCIFQALQPAACVKHAVKRAPKFMRHNDKNVTLLGVFRFL